MKTRVVRYWHAIDWLYQVQKYVQVTENDKFIRIGGLDSDPVPVVGSWRWELHIAPNGTLPGICNFSREFAMQIAERLAKSEPVPEQDVVAEYGD